MLKLEEGNGYRREEEARFRPVARGKGIKWELDLKEEATV